jgi:hypothetical protein
MVLTMQLQQRRDGTLIGTCPLVITSDRLVETVNVL